MTPRAYNIQKLLKTDKEFNMVVLQKFKRQIIPNDDATDILEDVIESIKK